MCKKCLLGMYIYTEQADGWANVLCLKQGHHRQQAAYCCNELHNLDKDGERHVLRENPSLSREQSVCNHPQVPTGEGEYNNMRMLSAQANSVHKSLHCHYTPQANVHTYIHLHTNSSTVVPFPKAKLAKITIYNVHRVGTYVHYEWVQNGTTH